MNAIGTRRAIALAVVIACLGVGGSALPAAAAGPTPMGWLRAGAIPARVEHALPPRLRALLMPSLPAAVGPGRRWRTVRAVFTDAASGYRWNLDAWRGPLGHDHLEIDGFKAGANGLGGQLYSWTFALPPGTLHLTPSKAHASLHTASALGPFGTIDLRFGDPAPRRSQYGDCETTFPPAPAALYEWNRGTLAGRFAFTPHEGSIPDPVLVGSMRAIVGSITYTGGRCPSNGGNRCYRQQGFAAWQDQTYLDAEPGPYGILDVVRFSHRGPAAEFDWLLLQAQGALARRRGSGAVIDGNLVSPDLSGTVTFSGDPTTVHAGWRCRHIYKTPERWASGSLTVGWDLGPTTLTGDRFKGVFLRRTN